MNKDIQGPLIAARSFFRQMCSYGYTPDQIIRIINELLELVTTSVRQGKHSAEGRASQQPPRSSIRMSPLRNPPPHTGTVDS